MKIREIVTLLAIPIVLATLPLENRLFWFHLTDNLYYAEHVIYENADTLCFVAKNLSQEEVTFVDSLVATGYYQVISTNQSFLIESVNMVYPQTVAFIIATNHSQPNHLVRVGKSAPMQPSPLRLQTPAEEEIGIYISIIIMVLIATLVYLVVLFDRETAVGRADKIAAG